MAASGQLSSIRLLQVLLLLKVRRQWERNRLAPLETNRLWPTSALAAVPAKSRNSGAWHSLTGYYLFPNHRRIEMITFFYPCQCQCKSSKIAAAVEDSSSKSLFAQENDTLAKIGSTDVVFLALLNGNSSSLGATLGVRLHTYLLLRVRQSSIIYNLPYSLVHFHILHSTVCEDNVQLSFNVFMRDSLKSVLPYAVERVKEPLCVSISGLIWLWQCSNKGFTSSTTSQCPFSHLSIDLLSLLPLKVFAFHSRMAHLFLTVGMHWNSVILLHGDYSPAG